MKLKYCKSKPLPCLSVLESFFCYDPETGAINWRRQYSSKNKGDIAGSLTNSRRHLGIGLDLKVYLAHRIAWALHYKEDPHPQMVDHINGNGTDNRIANLRIADYSENNCNARIRVDNKSGFKGVCFHRVTNKWQASVRKNNKVHYLGVYPTPEEAASVVTAARESLHQEFARHA